VQPAEKRPALRLVAKEPPVRQRAEPPLDDIQLVAAIRAGDAEAAETLHDRLRPRLQGTVRRLLGPGDPDAEDCVQNAFVEIVRSIERYRGESSLDHWAQTIASHVVYKHIRRRRTERRVFERGARTSDRPEPMSSMRQLVAKDLITRVREKLQALGNDKVYAFLLHDVLGFDLREISQITGVTVAAAQQRLVRGRREVHTRLGEDGELSSILENLEDP
jgi:RNA polymerase sigma-70 factor, ECF subfamily